jgi:hypothetical protein
MKKLIKTLVFVAILLTTTVTTAYALKPEQPNLSDLLQNILDYLENVLTPAISDLDSDLASHGTNVISEIQQSEANITAVVEQSEVNITTTVEQSEANIISEINTTHSTLETRLDAVPIMESYEGVWNGTLAQGEYATITNIGYTSIANFQVTMYASFPGTNYLASAFMSVYDEEGNVYTFNAGDTVRDGNQAYTVTFSSRRCFLRVLRGSNAVDDGQVIVSWSVTATYVP